MAVTSGSVAHLTLVCPWCAPERTGSGGGGADQPAVIGTLVKEFGDPAIGDSGSRWRVARFENRYSYSFLLRSGCRTVYIMVPCVKACVILVDFYRGRWKCFVSRNSCMCAAT